MGEAVGLHDGSLSGLLFFRNHFLMSLLTRASGGRGADGGSDASVFVGALVGGPEILLVDELLSGLPGTRRERALSALSGHSLVPPFPLVGRERHAFQ
jgi:hypothetical protein